MSPAPRISHASTALDAEFLRQQTETILAKEQVRDAARQPPQASTRPAPSPPKPPVQKPPVKPAQQTPPPVKKVPPRRSPATRQQQQPTPAPGMVQVPAEVLDHLLATHPETRHLYAGKDSQ